MTGTSRNVKTLYIALQSTGIVEVAFNADEADVEKSLSVVSTYHNAGTMPGWLAAYGDKLYSISRIHYPDASSESGGLFAFQQPDLTSSARPSSSGLTLLSERSSTGKGGVHIDISPDGKILAAANINGSTVALFPLLESGAIGEPAHTIYYDGEGPSVNNGKGIANPHEVRFDPTGRFLFVPLRSGDKLEVYAVDGPEKVTKIHSIELPHWTGARHSVIRPIDSHTAYLYLVSERDNQIRVFKLAYSSTDDSSLAVTLEQTLPLLDFTPTPGQKFFAAEVAVTADGRFVYASTRGGPVDTLDSDTLSIYKVNQPGAEDHLTYIGASKVQGHIPRNFTLSSDAENQWVAVANAYDQDIIVFERNRDAGFLGAVKGRLNLGAKDETLRKGPICILWQ